MESDDPSNLDCVWNALRFQLHGDTRAVALAHAIANLIRTVDTKLHSPREAVHIPAGLSLQAGFVSQVESDLDQPTEAPSLDDFVARSWLPDTELQVTFGLADRGVIRIDYLGSLWSAEFIDRMQLHFESLLESIVSDPGRGISQHRMLSDAEWHRIIVEWNCNAQDIPSDLCVHGLIVDQSIRTPEAIAVVCEEETLTYRELDDQSDRLAQHLCELGIMPGSLVGLSIEQSTRLIVAILGILKSGAAYVPLDIKHPADRLQAIVQDAGLVVVVTSVQLAPRLPVVIDQMVLIDALLVDPANQPQPERFHAEITQDHLAYVLYTSGTTGLPKGVAIAHRAVVNFLCAMAQRPGLKPGERLLSITSPSFDISVMETLLPLIVGATVEVVPAKHIKDPAALAEALQRSGAQMMQATPTTWQMMMLHGWTGHPNLKLITGGEPLSDTLAAQLMQRCDELWNQYGPTEATVYTTQYLVPPGGPNRSIGKPIANCQAYILDPYGNPVPVGILGEIFVGGEPLARGYLNREELTAQKFVRNPFIDDPNARIYQTGDLGRWTNDGDIECFGRIDHQIKLRGYRIELKEIEAWLSQWPGLRESVVRLREDTPGDPRLVAYCVFPDPPRPSPSEITAYLQQKLPEYMVPSDFVWLDQLPVTVNGKLDVKALPEPDRSHQERLVPYVAPRNALETIITDVFQSVLGIKMGILDAFFASGGHSLSAVRAIVRIRDHTGYPVRVRMLFEHPSVEELASFLDSEFGQYQEQVHAVDSSIVPSAGTSIHSEVQYRGDQCPLSFAQMRLWLVDEIENRTNVYNIPRAYRLRGPLDPKALSSAIERLIERHEPLRTVFRVFDGNPFQCVLPTPKLELAIESLEFDSTALLRQAIQSRFEQEADLPFNLDRDLPFRALLLRIAPDDHVLMTTTHHIASDEWSIDVFNSELSVAYRDALLRRPASLTPLPTRYVEYSVQQRRELSGTHYAMLLDYWKDHLKGLPTLDLPHDHARPQRPTYACGQQRMQFPPELVARLHTIARDCQSTLHMVFLAAFQCLMQKWSRQDDICIGMPIAGRMHEALEPMIGFFVNTLVIRGDLSGDPTFEELLSRVRATSLSAYDHQEMPFEKLVEELRPDRTFNSNPLVQVLFQLTNFDPTGLRLEGLDVQPLDLDEPRVRFDLEVYITQSGDSLQGAIHFARELFDPETISRMAQQYLTLLESIANAPSQRISELGWVSPEDTRRVLIDWNATQDAVPPHSNVIDWWDELVEQSPVAMALEMDDRHWTYRELQERTRWIADAIMARCKQPPRRVGIMMERSPELIAVILGVMRCGAAVVPVDPAYPDLRREFIIADAKIDLLVTTSGSVRLPSSLSVPVLEINSHAEIEFHTEAVPCYRRATPEDSVYILYTSGSTGQPKGVEMPHRAMLNLMHWHRSHEQLGRSARTLQFASCNFDVSFQEILSTLCTGGTLVLVSEEVRRDPEELWCYANHKHLERLFLPFVMLQQLAAITPESLPPVRDIVSAGESLLFTSELQKLLARLPDCRLHNHYGPTETHVITSHHVTERELQTLHESPIGKPIFHSQVYVLDSQRRPLPPGIPGDLWLSGDCLALGYVDRPDLTESRFNHIVLPLVGEKRMYQSGDLGRWNHRGELTYLGRSDDQVKYRGVRIELGEIEAKLLEHPAVLQAAVAIKQNSDGLQRLCAYYVLREGAKSSQGELQGFLRQRLPDAMVPNAWFSLDALPMTASGKLNRRALPDTILWQTDSTDDVPPNTPMERMLADAWMELLGVESVNATDHFFALGGHSLLAARLRSRLMRELGCSIPLRRMFEFPVLRDFASSLDADLSVDTAPMPHEIIPRTGAVRGPLSCSQARLWFLESLSDGVFNAYNLNFACKLFGPLDTACLRNGFEALIDRYQILRTRYLQEDGEIVQEVLDSVRIDWYEEVLDRASQTDDTSRCEEIVSERAQRPFDLTRGEVVRATLVTCAPDVHVFSITMHHIAFDGGSISIFLGDLSDAYRQGLQGQPMHQPETPMQYLDYAIWQRSSLTKPSTRDSLAFWKNALDGIRPLELPLDFPRPEHASNRGDSVSLHMDRDLLDALKRLGQSCHATLQMTLMASFQLLLGRFARTNDLAVGTATAGRNSPQLESLVGFTANTVLLRTQLHWDESFLALLQRVQSASLDVYAHDELPFDFLVEHIQPDRQSNRLPLVQALLQVLPSELHALQLPDVSVAQFPTRVATCRFELEAHLWEQEAELKGYLVYSAELFHPARMQDLADRWMSLVHQIARDPSRHLDEYEFLLPSERQSLLVGRNQTAKDIPTGSVADVFRCVASQYPERIALIDGERRWTYDALNRASEQCAEELRQRGVRSGDAIAMLLPRSPQMIVAMLAILKAGGCYVPLSPEDPAPRLETILHRSNSVIVLTDDQRSLPMLDSEIPWMSMHSWTRPDSRSAEGESRDSETAPFSSPAPDDLAYILFTSGSTGEPKGVCVEHRSILRLVFGNDYAKFGSDRVFLQLAPAAFDAATFEVWGALLHGAQLVLAPPDRVPDLAVVGAMIQQHRVTTLWLTASLFNQWIEEAPQSLVRVEEILTGGEALSVPHIRMAQNRLGPGVQLINGYGPTECTTFATCYRIPYPLDDRARSIPIGRPIGNTMAWVVDDRQTLVPPGTVGELLLGGIGLARGYLAEESLTQSRFLQAPWPEFSGTRAYRTGDLVRWNCDGDLEFVGRTDEQVKLRGFRIELGEIESHLMMHPDVQRCVVQITTDRQNNEILAAYIIPSNPTDFAPDRVREHLRARLPSYMIPAAYLTMDHIPMKENGKVDAQRLPRVDSTMAIGACESVPPRSETERQMLELWKDVLGKSGFGVMDGFFDLGGHSLLAVKLFAKIEKHFGVKLPLAMLFQHGTVSQLASQLGSASGGQKWVDVVPLCATDGGHPLYLLPSLGGELLHLRPLVDAMQGCSTPLVGLQPIPSEEYALFAGDLQATAEKYVETIRTRQAKGPYRLGGFSYGGMLAFEMARQLSYIGETVDYLAIIDTGPCWSGQTMKPRDRLAWSAAVLRNLPGWIHREWKHTPWSVIVSSVKRKSRYAFRWMSSFGHAKTTYDDIFESPRIASRDTSIMRLCFEAFTSYTSDMTAVSIAEQARYAGNVHLFRTGTQSLMSGAQFDLGWSRWANNVTVHVLPGNHEMVFSSPSVEVLAREIDRGLRLLNQGDVSLCSSP